MASASVAGARNDPGATFPLAPAPPRTTDYSICGWRVSSSVALPEAMPWAGDNQPPDISIRFGPAPPLVDSVAIGGGVTVGRDGTCHLDIEGVACFLVAHGREIVVEPLGDSSMSMLSAFLLGPVLGVLCHQRRLFPLHAACVRIDGGAIALTGRSGAGKSTLAAALVCRGHGLVADDVCVIDVAASGGPTVLPTFPRLKLWEDAMQGLDIPTEGAARARTDRPKFHFCEPGYFDPSPVKLRAIYVLGRSLTTGDNDIRPLHGADAADALAREIYRPGIGFRLGRKVALLSAALGMASTIPVWRMPPRPELSRLDATAARVEAHFASAATNICEPIASAAR